MSSTTYMVNLDTAPWPVYEAINDLDKRWVGTDNYQGIAYFWSWEYRHWLRPATPARRRQVHRKMLAAGLVPNESSDAHLTIIEQSIKTGGAA